jgi:hypothetical protein
MGKDNGIANTWWWRHYFGERLCLTIILLVTYMSPVLKDDMKNSCYNPGFGRMKFWRVKRFHESVSCHLANLIAVPFCFLYWKGLPRIEQPFKPSLDAHSGHFTHPCSGKAHDLVQAQHKPTAWGVQKGPKTVRPFQGSPACRVWRVGYGGYGWNFRESMATPCQTPMRHSDAKTAFPFTNYHAPETSFWDKIRTYSKLKAWSRIWMAASRNLQFYW